MIDWIEQDKARLRDIEIYLAEAEFLGLSDEEVATLENEANEIEGALSDFNEWSRPMDESLLSYVVVSQRLRPKTHRPKIRKSLMLNNLRNMRYRLRANLFLGSLFFA